MRWKGLSWIGIRWKRIRKMERKTTVERNKKTDRTQKDGKGIRKMERNKIRK